MKDPVVPLQCWHEVLDSRNRMSEGPSGDVDGPSYCSRSGRWRNPCSSRRPSRSLSQRSQIWRAPSTARLMRYAAKPIAGIAAAGRRGAGRFDLFRQSDLCRGIAGNRGGRVFMQARGTSAKCRRQTIAIVVKPTRIGHSPRSPRHCTHPPCVPGCGSRRTRRFGGGPCAWGGGGRGRCNCRGGCYRRPAGGDWVVAP